MQGSRCLQAHAYGRLCVNATCSARLRHTSVHRSTECAPVNHPLGASRVRCNCVFTSKRASCGSWWIPSVAEGVHQTLDATLDRAPCPRASGTRTAFLMVKQRRVRDRHLVLRRLAAPRPVTVVGCERFAHVSFCRMSAGLSLSVRRPSLGLTCVLSDPQLRMPARERSACDPVRSVKLTLSCMQAARADNFYHPPDWDPRKESLDQVCSGPASRDATRMCSLQGSVSLPDMQLVHKTPCNTVPKLIISCLRCVRHRFDASYEMELSESLHTHGSQHRFARDADVTSPSCSIMAPTRCASARASSTKASWSSGAPLQPDPPLHAPVPFNTLRPRLMLHVPSLTTQTPLVYSPQPFMQTAPFLPCRFEMPFHVWCDGCGELIGKGVRFNAEKQQTGTYLKTRVWSFTMRHHCGSKIVVRTDPKSCEYIVETGAKRKVRSDWQGARGARECHPIAAFCGKH